MQVIPKSNPYNKSHIQAARVHGTKGKLDPGLLPIWTKKMRTLPNQTSHNKGTILTLLALYIKVMAIDIFIKCSLNVAAIQMAAFVYSCTITVKPLLKTTYI